MEKTEASVAASAPLCKGGVRQSVSFAPFDFITANGTAIDGWSDVYVLSLRAYAEPGARLVGSQTSGGPIRPSPASLGIADGGGPPD